MKHDNIMSRMCLALLAAWPVWVFAQEAVQEEPQNADAAETASESAETTKATSSVWPVPGDDVMVPTSRGFRMSPTMCSLLARGLAQETMEGKDYEALAQRFEKRFQDIYTRHGKEGTEGLEYFIEFMIQQETSGDMPNNDKAYAWKFDADTAREFSSKIRPGVGIMNELIDGMMEDMKPEFTPEKLQEAEHDVAEARRAIQRFDEKMDRWSRGEIKENESLLDGIEEERKRPEDAGKSKEYLSAEQQVHWDVERLGPTTWQWFLDRAGRVFKFDEAQRDAGKKILDAYREKANAIMTKEWKAKAKANRVTSYLQRVCPKEPLEPWAFHLDQDFKEMAKPLEDMGRAFRGEILALARPEQRQAMLAEMADMATQMGLPADELSRGTTLLMSEFETAATSEPAP